MNSIEDDDLDTLAPTLPYDYLEDHQDNTYSDEQVITATTQLPSSPSAAHPSTSSYSTYSPRHFETTSSEYGNSGSSVGSQRFGPHSFDKDANLLLMEADQRLFRHPSATPGYVYFNDSPNSAYNTGTSNKRNVGATLKKNATDLTLTSDWNQQPHFLDKPRLEGKLTNKQRKYFETELTKTKEHMAFLKINNTASVGEQSSTAETELGLIETNQQYSHPSVSTMDSYHHSSYPSDHTLSSPSQPSIHGSSTDISYQVDSTCPMEDHNTMEHMDDEESDDAHLCHYSPERSDDFAQQLSKQPSSTPIKSIGPSSFPEMDHAIYHQYSGQYSPENTDDTPYSRFSITSSVRNTNDMASPDLIDHRQHRETRTVSHKQKKPTVIPPLRPQRSSSSIMPRRPYIMFSSTVDHHKYRHRAEAMGAIIINNWELCTHMVTDKFRRTPNLLCALASQKFVVSESWIKDSISNSQFEDETSYILRKPILPNHFAGKKLFFTPSADIKKVDAHDLAKAAGAKLHNDEPNLKTIDSNLIVIYSANEADESRFPYQAAGYETMSRKTFIDLFEQ